jgi:NAD(P)-dependent dehydrogenase (short-subunit alcohol dehydrogenase family)
LTVTGSGRGIGAAIALALAERGMNVVINYGRSAGAAESTAVKARSFGVKAITVKANVLVRTNLRQIFETAINEFGSIDLVMSNSGIAHFGRVETTTEEEIDKTFAVNIKAQYFVAQEAYKYLADNGRLILTSSISAQKVCATGLP